VNPLCRGEWDRKPEWLPGFMRRKRRLNIIRYVNVGEINIDLIF